MKLYDVREYRKSAWELNRDTDILMENIRSLVRYKYYSHRNGSNYLRSGMERTATIYMLEGGGKVVLGKKRGLFRKAPLEFDCMIYGEVVYLQDRGNKRVYVLYRGNVIHHETYELPFSIKEYSFTFQNELKKDCSKLLTR